MRKLLIISALCASFFFISCGIPQSPFILDDSDVLISVSSADSDLALAYPETTEIPFTVAYPGGEVFDTNGVNIYYLYSQNETYSFSLLDSIADEIDSRRSEQIINLGDTDYQIYRFIGDTSYMPTLLTDSVVLTLPDKTEPFTVLIRLDKKDNALFLNLSIPESDTDVSVDLYRYNRTTTNIIYHANSSFENYEINESETYYLYLFGTIYARNNDSTSEFTADTEGVFLGSIELP